MFGFKKKKKFCLGIYDSKVAQEFGFFIVQEFFTKRYVTVTSFFEDVYEFSKIDEYHRIRYNAFPTVNIKPEFLLKQKVKVDYSSYFNIPQSMRPLAIFGPPDIVIRPTMEEVQIHCKTVIDLYYSNLQDIFKDIDVSSKQADVSTKEEDINSALEELADE